MRCGSSAWRSVKSTVLPKSRCLIARFLRPSHCQRRSCTLPWWREGGGKELLEPVVAHQLSDLTFDRFLRAGTVTCDSLLDGDTQLEESLSGLALQQV